MEIELSGSPRSGDRRVRRTRSALVAAAVELVSERDSTEVSVTELAEAADVSRRVLYQHFGDRETLFAEAAAELLRQQLLPRLRRDDGIDIGATTLAIAEHFAEHRRFYRAVLAGSCAYAVGRTLAAVFHPYSAAAAHRMFGPLDDRTAAEVANFFTGATTAALTEWLTEAPSPLDPDEFTRRLARIQSVLEGATRRF
ncbi:TetR/AcrR family transcriptional regulator [Nocardia barduliensis]|uniref:TetR/AcrR family transcriptional regulator n=1 Tax=Nocardia barduliensis TaxID=2736643 RepID=UPI0015741840|nr:TetR/AcrR family transcriptional regulator [Nocardia barduliensis]